MLGHYRAMQLTCSLYVYTTISMDSLPPAMAVLSAVIAGQDKRSTGENVKSLIWVIAQIKSSIKLESKLVWSHDVRCQNNNFLLLLFSIQNANISYHKNHINFHIKEEWEKSIPRLSIFFDKSFIAFFNQKKKKGNGLKIEKKSIQTFAIISQKKSFNISFHPRLKNIPKYKLTR